MEHPYISYVNFVVVGYFETFLADLFADLLRLLLLPLDAFFGLDAALGSAFSPAAALPFGLAAARAALLAALGFDETLAARFELRERERDLLEDLLGALGFLDSRATRFLELDREVRFAALGLLLDRALRELLERE